ncbi:MAG: hypothetical protein ACPGLV_06065 [Bacteroidia bacterium]
MAKNYGYAELKNDTLWLSNSANERNPRPELFIDSLGDTLILIGFEGVESCLCFYNLEFRITGVEKKQYPVCLNGKVLPFYSHPYPLLNSTFSLYKGDTINYIDKYGFKHGKHFEFNAEGMITRNVFYRNDTLMTGVLKRTFYRNGNTRYESIQTGVDFGVNKNYSRGGKLKSYCKWKGAPFLIDEPCTTL